ncbi:DUF21 domain-containing protein [bacterium 3DAC]|jgi:putative hemolysin|nr:HlyC/CorC family transporter [Dictyoglomota bacterium]UZN22836.1 DUF21 domain-containing protein [bacterium 3DAC]
MGSSNYVSSILVILLALVFNGILAASEIAFVSMKRHRIKRLVEEGYRPARILEKFSEDTSKFFTTIQFGISFVGFLSSMVAAQSFVEPLVQWLHSIHPGISISLLSAVVNVLMSILLALIFMIFGELVPKSLAYHMSEKVALKTATFLNIIYTIFMPLIFFVSSIVNGILKLFGISEVSSYAISEEDIRDMLQIGESQGVIEETEKEMIYSIFEFGDKVVRDVFVPRPYLFAIPITSTLEEALDKLLESGHSRAPVYGENLDDIRGIIHIKDVVKAIYKGAGKSINDILRAPYFIPETWPLVKAFMEMRKNRVVMAIVIDEYGTVSGIITMEDILEEIVGEIRDEYDVEEDPIKVVEETDTYTVYEVQGIVSLKDIAEELEVELDDKEVDTIGGFVIYKLGRFPKVGDVIEIEGGITLEVVDADSRRVRKVRIKVPKHKTNTEHER